MGRCALALILAAGSLLGQEDTRQIFDTHFGKSRVATATNSPPVNPQYRRAAESPAAKAGKTTVSKSFPANRKSISPAMGVTIWKMLPSAVGDPARLLVLEAKGRAKAELTPHRVEAGELLRLGDQVRLSIETPESGFVYVVDQELYDDGSFGPPYLIFPVSATRHGDNRVAAGQLIEIPDQGDPVNVFTISAKGRSDRGERLTILLSKQPIPGLAMTEQPRQLPGSTFQSWVKQFESAPEHFELANGSGLPWTKTEQEAGADPKRLLTLGDPPPQTIFVFSGSRGKGIMATILLSFLQ